MFTLLISMHNFDLNERSLRSLKLQKFYSAQFLPSCMNIRTTIQLYRIMATEISIII
jgi:hypothetical protein